jgi:hypothetical protein
LQLKLKLQRSRLLKSNSKLNSFRSNKKLSKILILTLNHQRRKMKLRSQLPLSFPNLSIMLNLILLKLLHNNKSQPNCKKLLRRVKLKRLIFKSSSL